jgi:hypothetical protein
MRARGFLLLAGLAACQVPDKNPAGVDAGTDAFSPIDAPPDDLAPETTITSAPEEFSREGTAAFEFTADEAGATFECSIDGDSPVACASPYSRSLGDGTHAFTVRAIDAAGNGDDSPAEHLWSIDRVAPNTMMTDHPPAADNSVLVEFSFESDEDNVTFECSLDSGAYEPCESGDQVGPLSDGAHSFAVHARDRAGNVDSSPAVFAWTINTSTPDTQITSGPSGPTASTTATFSFLSPDAGPGATFQCSLDDATFVTCTSPRVVNGLGQGNHTFEVRVRDSVGNLDPSPASRAWSVDLTPPNTTIQTGPSGLVAQASASFTFTSNEAGVIFQCRHDGMPFATCTSPHNLASLSQGAHSFEVRAVDAAGHEDPTPASRNWTVDTIAPDVSITSGPGDGTTSGPFVSFAFTVSDGAVACSLDGAPFTACTSPQELSLPAGAHDLQVRATDPAGNVTIVGRAWTVACSAPDPIGAAGLLHLDDAGQVLDNAVAGGAPATLGDDDTVEVADPDPGVPGRFGTALAFTGAEIDHVSWPVALAPTDDFTIELWAHPTTNSATRDLVVTIDNRIRIRLVTVNPTRVRFTATVQADLANSWTVQSAPLDPGEWHHVLASRSGATLRLWVDGVRTEIGGVNAGPPLELDALRIGGKAPVGYTGSLDEIWFAPTATTTDDDARARYCPL